MAKRTVDLSPRAQRQIRSARNWWLENRDKAPEAFDEDLYEMLERIAENPGIGVLVASRRVKDLRRVLLERSSHHLYYRTKAEDQIVEVLCLWYAGRAEGPVL